MLLLAPFSKYYDFDSENDVMILNKYVLSDSTNIEPPTYNNK